MSAITVVITAFNLEKYMDRCLKELYGQTMKDFDILIVDDASSDRTRQIIENWRDRFEGRLTTAYLKERLGMPALTRNYALESGCINGEYVLFLDGDDSIEPDMLEALYALAVSEEDVGVVFCAFDRVDIATGEVISTEMKGFPRLVSMPPQDDMIAFLNTSPWNKLWRRTVIEDLRYSEFRVGEEVAFNFNGYVRCRKIMFTDRVLIHYGIRKDSVIANTEEHTIWEFADELLKLYEKQEGVYRELAGELAFVHIGLSMGLRAADNPNIDLKRHIKKTEGYFKEGYQWFSGNSFMRFSSLRRRGMKGMLLWTACLMYKWGMFLWVLKLYRRLGLNIKF